jgi:hypothetical protein
MSIDEIFATNKLVPRLSAPFLRPTPTSKR